MSWTRCTVKPRIMESYVIRKDGLIICSYIPGSNSQRISAMSAALMELGKRTLKNIGNDDMKLIMVSGNKMNIVISGSNSIALVCAVGSEVNIGMIFLLIKKSSAKNTVNTGRKLRKCFSSMDAVNIT